MSEKETIVELREIYSCLALSKNIGAKAFMTFMLSSGMYQHDALDLTIKDLLNACNALTLSNLLTRNPNNRIPIWIKEDETKYKLNFSSPESLFYIFLYLKKRRLKEGSLKEDDKLFDISTSTLKDNFKLSEKLTELKSYYPLKDNVSHKFTYKYLQRFFIQQYLEHSSIIMDKKQLKYKDGKQYPAYKVKLIDLFTKGLKKDDEYYNKFYCNKQTLLFDYEYRVLPYITAKNYDRIRPSWNKMSEDEEMIIRNVNENNNKKYTDMEIKKIINDYIFYKQKDNITDTELIEIFEFATSDNERWNFKNSEEYLNNLLLRIPLKKDIEKAISEDTKISVHNDEEISKLISSLKKDIIEKYEINDREIWSQFGIWCDYDNYNEKHTYLKRENIFELFFDAMRDSTPYKDIFIKKTSPRISDDENNNKPSPDFNGGLE